jgi:hypothetical protein
MFSPFEIVACREQLPRTAQGDHADLVVCREVQQLRDLVLHLERDRVTRIWPVEHDLQDRAFPRGQQGLESVVHMCSESTLTADSIPQQEMSTYREPRNAGTA